MHHRSSPLLTRRENPIISCEIVSCPAETDFVFRGEFQQGGTQRRTTSAGSWALFIKAGSLAYLILCGHNSTF